MTISRRDFLESSALSGAGLAIGNILGPMQPVAEAEVPNTLPPFGKWPLKPEFRVVRNFDQAWRFSLPDKQADTGAAVPDNKDVVPANDAAWEQVNLPHAVRLEPFNASGGRNYQGICWYQKRFAILPEWRSRIIQLVFQGAMQVADVWMNGNHLSTHYGGYLLFVVDISAHAHFGNDDENILTVRLNNCDNPQVPPGKPQHQLDFVYFGGLYRSVQLQLLADLHISDPVLANKPAGGGIVVTFPGVAADAATVQVQTDVANASTSSRSARVRHELRAPDGSVAATSEVPISVEASSSNLVTQRLTVRRPLHWHPDHPNLSILRKVILDHGKPVDDLYTRLGI